MSHHPIERESEAKERPRSSNSRRAKRRPAKPVASKRRRIVDILLGALSGALVGFLGFLGAGSMAPPLALCVGLFAIIGAISGYIWGDRMHGPLWDAFMRYTHGPD